MIISIADIEQAINYWRKTLPSDAATMQLCPPASALARLYAEMIYFGWTHCDLNTVDKEVSEAWYGYCNHQNNKAAA